MTAKLAIGSGGVNAVRLATVEPRREHEMSLNNQRMEEQRVQLWWRQWSATLRDAQVPSSHIFIIFILTNWRHLVDCKVGNWKPWGKCSVTCGGGTKKRGREVIREAKNAGASCPGLEETEVCNTEECPGTLFSSSYLY